VASVRARSETRTFRRFWPLALVIFAALAVAGCASGSLSGVFSSKNKDNLPPISFAPIFGAPSQVENQLSGQLVTEAKQKNIPVVTEKGKSATFTVRGYLTASKERNSNKLAYIWDVTDKSGKRVHRILGEESTPAKAGRDAWSTFDSAALQKIAAKTATDLAEWLPTQAPAASQKPAVAAQTASAKPESSKPVRTASVKPAEAMAYVPSVSGAPGDGKKSLTLAIKKQLFAKGIKLASASGSNVYTVRGKVTMGRPSGGQQDIKIDWQVYDPRGRRLGTVTQANKVAQGSLEGKWGSVADDAARDAAKGIAKLIPGK
jgi:hypothetical protein